jgi:hypothetical protein
VRVRTKTGVLVVWGQAVLGRKTRRVGDAWDALEAPKTVDLWIERAQRHGKLKRWRGWGLAVLDMADLFDLTAFDRTAGAPFEVVDLTRGMTLGDTLPRYAKTTGIQLEPFPRRAAGDATVPRVPRRAPRSTIQRLRDGGFTVAEVALEVGQSIAFVRRTLRRVSEAQDDVAPVT